MSGKAEDAGAENMQSENMRQDDMRAENVGLESGAAAKRAGGVSVAGVNAACGGSNAKPAAENARAESDISAKKAAAKNAAAKNAAAESNAGAGEDAESAAGPAAEPDSVSGVSGRSPRLRFAGFDKPWQMREVSELLVERNEQAPESKKYPLMAFIGNKGVAPKGERYDRGALIKDAKNKNYKRTELGDFIYSSNNLETGSIGLNNYGNASISPVYSIFKSTGIADSDFIGRRFIRKDFINSMIKWRQGVVYGQWRIHESDFLKIEVPVPSVGEQRQIGMFFSGLDRIISVQERKTELLRLSKKYFLQNMFPRRGESAPRLRVHGFTQPWQTRKISEIADRYDNLRVPVAASLRVKGETPYYGANGIQDYVEGYTHDGEFILVAEDGANDLKNYPVNYVNGRVWVNNHAHVLQAKEGSADNKFLGYAIGRADIESVLVGCGRVKLNANVLMDINLVLPSVVEQRQIGMFFSSLDRIISVQERKTEALRQAKKYYLQNMFA